MAEMVTTGGTLTRRAFFERALLLSTMMEAARATRARAQTTGFDRDAAAHLLRRAGFSGTSEEIERLVTLGREGAVDYLLNYEQIDDSAMERGLERYIQSQNLNLTQFRPIQIWWLYRMIYTKRPFLEKMTLFWHGHFATAIKKVAIAPLMLQQNQTLRRFALGSFEALTLEVAKDPAMILWLDNNTNIKGAPNENFARELFELFTLGIRDPITGQPAYTEQDIKEAARAFTGWTIRRGQFYFNASQHDDGEKTVLGRRGNWNGNDVIAFAVAERSTARFIAKKLWEFFAYPNPEPQIIEALADVYFAEKYSIKAVMRALFLREEFYAERARFAVIKSPVELVVGAIRQLQADLNLRALPGLLSLMEQDLFNPPDVSGWAGQLKWINTATMLVRYNFANLLATARGGTTGTFSPERLLAGKSLQTPEQLVEYLLQVLGPLHVSDATKRLFVDYLAEGGFRLDAQTIDNKVRGVIHLMMALPHYQLN
uniref:Hypothetical conserved protein n=2 Tax=Candidatus Bipolaricaulota TaxID=67810 RepID=H5SEV7_9BACT|nr:hypothetical conserved protein [uncultured Acetothermia bacterium]BAL58321.1 hypothetical conserved protein [Candidatus Acetothermum autotrophicum]